MIKTIEEVVESEGLKLLSPDLLSNEELAELYPSLDKIISWATQLKKYMLDQAVNHGITYEGLKIVEGKSNRTYTNEEDVIKALELEGYDSIIFTETKLLGLTKLEKALGKKTFNAIVGPFVHKPTGAPTLVAIEDERSAIEGNINVFDAFEVLD